MTGSSVGLEPAVGTSPARSEAVLAESHPGADAGAVGAHLATVLADPRWGESTLELVAGGKSNLTFIVRSTAGEAVLRRPPLGAILASAHDMGREHRVIRALGPTAVPVPQAFDYCTDTSVIGAEFHVMSRVVGHIVREEFPAGYATTDTERGDVGRGLVDTLAALHSVDVPAVGLSEFGRPDGYLPRQLRRWGGQWEASRVVELPQLDTLLADLAQAMPVTQRTTVVHGDYRMDNTLLHPSIPGRVAAILDWELSTLGDPLADLGLLIVYWDEAGEDAQANGLSAAATATPGMPTRAEVAERYAASSGLDLSDLPWYVAFGYAKLAVVCAGIVARVRAGAYGDHDVGDVTERIGLLTELGREVWSARAL